MDLLLLIVTGASLSMALVFGFMLRRIAGEERDRSAARVAALAAAASEGAKREIRIVPNALEPRPAELPEEWASLAEGTSTARVSHEDASQREVVQEPWRMLPADASPSDARQRRLAFGAAAFLLLLLSGLAWSLTSKSTAQPTEEQSAGARSPLELLALVHERRGEELAIRGLIRNPAGGDPLEQLTATVQLLDARGAAVATADSAIDVLALGPGDESSFVIQVRPPGGVVRYRVSFQAKLGVVPHVDRRNAAPNETAKANPERPR